VGIGITGTAALAATTKSTAADTGTNLDNSSSRLHITDAEGRHITLRVCSDGPGNMLVGGTVSRTPLLAFSAGGQQAEVLLRLTQANCNDILATIATFANTGTLS
jgi:hypothetical protein